MIVIGIDNGLLGAIVALDGDGALVSWADTPVVSISKTRFQLAPSAMRGVLTSMVAGKDRAVVFIEHGQPIGTDGVISNWHGGASYMGWRCLCAALEIPWEDVRAQVWQRSMLRGVPGDDTKTKSLHRAQGMFPSLPLRSSDRAKKLNMDGRSDAALIAEYGRRRLRGEE